MTVTWKHQPLDRTRVDDWIWVRTITYHRGDETVQVLYRECLDFFLQNWNVDYNDGQQNAFLKDLWDIVRPMGKIEIRKAIFDLHERHQNTVMERKLNEIAMAEEVTVNIRFSPLKMDLFETSGYRIGQNYVAISRMGKTNFYTDGFAGCLGMLLTPIGGVEGGVLAHISESGWKTGDNVKTPTRTDYYIDVMKGILAKASETWKDNKFDMTLFVGEDNGAGDDIQLPDLVTDIRGASRKLPTERIRYIHDLRRLKERAMGFFFDSQGRTLWLLGGIDMTVESERIDAFWERTSGVSNVNSKQYIQPDLITFTIAEDMKCFTSE